MSIEQSIYESLGDSGGVEDKGEISKDEQIEKTEPSSEKKPDTTPDEMPEEIKEKFDAAVKGLNLLESKFKNNIVGKSNLDEAWRAIANFDSSDSHFYNYKNKTLEFYQRFRDLIPKNEDYSEERMRRADRNIQDLEEYHAIIDKAKEELGEEGSKDSVFLGIYIHLGQLEQRITDGVLNIYEINKGKEYFEKVLSGEIQIPKDIPNREQIIERHRVLLEKAKQIEQKEKKKF